MQNPGAPQGDRDPAAPSTCRERSPPGADGSEAQSRRSPAQCPRMLYWSLSISSDNLDRSPEGGVKM